MSSVKVDSSGVNRLLARMEKLDSPEFLEKLVRKSVESAENARTTAQSIVYGPYLHYETGETGDKIEPYTQQTEESISFGISTNNLRTIYHEMGTGPVGMSAGYPGEELLDQPIAWRTTPWTGPFGGLNEGVPPKAFMHNAMEMEREAADLFISEMLEEVLHG